MADESNLRGGVYDYDRGWGGIIYNRITKPDAGKTVITYSVAWNNMVDIDHDIPERTVQGWRQAFLDRQYWMDHADIKVAEATASLKAQNEELRSALKNQNALTEESIHTKQQLAEAITQRDSANRILAQRTQEANNATRRTDSLERRLKIIFGNYAKAIGYLQQVLHDEDPIDAIRIFLEEHAPSAPSGETTYNIAKTWQTPFYPGTITADLTILAALQEDLTHVKDKIQSWDTWGANHIGGERSWRNEIEVRLKKLENMPAAADNKSDGS